MALRTFKERLPSSSVWGLALCFVFGACTTRPLGIAQPDAAVVRTIEQEAAAASTIDLDSLASRRLCALCIDWPQLAASLCAALRENLDVEPVVLTRIVPAQLRALAARMRPPRKAAALTLAEVAEAMQGAVHERIHEVAGRVLHAADRLDLRIVAAPEIGLNAFIPVQWDPRAIYVGTELGVFAQNDDELACVIGHELGHLTEGHVRSGVLVNAGKTVLGTLATAAIAGVIAYGTGRALTKAEVQGAHQLGTGLRFLLADVPLRLGGWERAQEREADIAGALWAARAGYAPEACADFMFRMAQLEHVHGNELGPRWWRVHPIAADRVAALRMVSQRIRRGAP